jgi:hypothetical protein
MKVSGLERLKSVCERLELGVRTKPPSKAPPIAGSQVAGLPMDPVLAAVYAQVSQATFATKLDGLVLIGDKEGEFGLEMSNKEWLKAWQEDFALPLFRFAGEPFLAYYYATVPALADEHGFQPVVYVDTYEMPPYALPLASNVDRFFELYARYFEALVASPGYDPSNGTGLPFPWAVPHLLRDDTKLMELVRSGAFAALATTEEARSWVAKLA